MSQFVTVFMADESGVAGIEYGLIAALMAVVIIAAITTFAPKLVEAFTQIGSKMQIT